MRKLFVRRGSPKAVTSSRPWGFVADWAPSLGARVAWQSGEAPRTPAAVAGRACGHSSPTRRECSLLLSLSPLGRGGSLPGTGNGVPTAAERLWAPQQGKRPLRRPRHVLRQGVHNGEGRGAHGEQFCAVPRAWAAQSSVCYGRGTSL